MITDIHTPRYTHASTFRHPPYMYMYTVLSKAKHHHINAHKKQETRNKKQVAKEKIPTPNKSTERTQSVRTTTHYPLIRLSHYIYAQVTPTKTNKQTKQPLRCCNAMYKKARKRNQKPKERKGKYQTLNKSRHRT